VASAASGPEQLTPGLRVQFITKSGGDRSGYSQTVRSLAISPDGTRAAFSVLHPSSDIWILERVKK